MEEKLKSIKIILAVLPGINTIYICWYIGQLIKLQWMNFSDSFSEPRKETIAHQEKLILNEKTFAASLCSAALLLFIFGQESALNTVTYVIGLYIVNTVKVLIAMQTSFLMS